MNGSFYPATIDGKTANGNWNWVYDGDFYAGPGWYAGTLWEGYVPKTKRSSVNRDCCGKSDRYPEHIPWHGHMASKWVDINPLTGQYELTRNVMGVEEQAFNYGYNTIFSRWSSPSTYDGGAKDIAFEIFNEYNGSITVKAYNTYNSCLNLKPSRPQFLKVSASGNNPQLTWIANLEPDLVGYSIDRAEGKGPGLSWENGIGQTTGTSYIDYDVALNPVFEDEVSYRIRASDTQGKYSDYSEAVWIGDAVLHKTIPELDEIYDFAVDAYPNPFNPSTTIRYAIPKDGEVTLKIYDILGREVKTLVNEVKTKGRYEVVFDASQLASGLYIYEITSGSFKASKKMTLIK